MGQTENTQNDRILHDEIDLRFVYGKIKQLFLSWWGFFIFCFTVALKRWILLLAFVLLGASVGIGLFYNTRPVYTSTLTITSHALANDFCSDILGNLNLMIRDKSPEVLAQNLKIDVSTAKSIKLLEFDNYDEKLKKIYKNKDTVVLGRPFKIKAYMYTNTGFDTLQTALVNYLENNEYAFTRKQIKMQNIVTLREAIKKQISQLDSLKFKASSGMTPRGTSPGGFVFGEPIDPINYFKQEILLLEKDLVLNRDLILIDNIQVIQDFTPRAVPDSPRLRRNILTYALIFSLIGFIIAFYLERKNNPLIS